MVLNVGVVPLLMSGVGWAGLSSACERLSRSYSGKPVEDSLTDALTGEAPMGGSATFADCHVWGGSRRARFGAESEKLSPLSGQKLPPHFSLCLVPD